MHPFARFVNPELADLLWRLRLDKEFVRGEGTRLYDREGRCYLDFVASYGALPFGFNPPEVWAALQEVAARGEPSFVQPSFLSAAGALAERLVEVAPPGLRYVTFTNSGTEAVEAALKLARARTRRRRILATVNSFHGKTLGALSATGRAAYQEPFGAPVEGFAYVPYGDLEALDAALSAAAREGDPYAAFIVEPIQGEGGIVVPPQGYLAGAREICRRYQTLLILDEVQTGLGRTGRLFAAEEEGVTPDILTLAKALGGGLVPIGACLYTEAAYSPSFALKHSSTFAGNALACRAGLAVLELLTRDNAALVREVAQKGEQLRAGLQELARRFPEVIREVRGRGLMLGVEFGVRRGWPPGGGAGSLLGVMGEQELLAPVAASYLLNVEGLRVAPTLNGGAVLRIEPPLTVTRAECDRAVAAMERLVQVIAAGETGRLLLHLVRPAAAPYTPRPSEEPAGPAPAPAAAPRVAGGGAPIRNGAPPGQAPGPHPQPGDGRFAFLVHPLDFQNYTEFDPSLGLLTEAELQELAGRWNELVAPFVIGATRVVSKVGAAAYGEFVVVPRTTGQLLEMDREEAVAVVRQAVELARDRGAGIVGLGAYTAIVSHGGLLLRSAGVPLTTGNSYTVVAAIEAVQTAAERLGLPLERAAAAVVGATGSIGRATALLLAERVARLILVGNPRAPARAEKRLLAVVAELLPYLRQERDRGRSFPPGSLAEWLLEQAFPADGAPGEVGAWLGREAGERLLLGTDAGRLLREADVSVVATSSMGELVTPEMLKPGAVVLDLSRPPNVSRRVERERPDVLVLDGGVVEVPGRPYLGWDFGFEPGLAYACMSETMMLALEQRYADTGLGSDIGPESLELVRRLADRHGFRLACFRSFDRPLPDEKWAQVMAARARAKPAGAAAGAWRGHD